MPRFRLWYTSRARIVSTPSPGRGSGDGGGASGPDVVFSRCSGVFGSSHGSAARRAVVENARGQQEDRSGAVAAQRR